MIRETQRQNNFQEMQLLNDDFINLNKLYDILFIDDDIIFHDDDIIDSIYRFKPFLEKVIEDKKIKVNQLFNLLNK